MDLSLTQLFAIARRWWWLLALAPLLGGGAAYWSSTRQLPLYAAVATIEVNPPQTSATVDYSALQGSRTLADTYRLLITTRNVLAPLVDQLQLPYDVSALQGKVSASTVGNTQLVRISVSDTDPQQAAILANAIAQRFADYTTERALQLSNPYRTALDQLIASMASQIQQTQDEIQALDRGGTSAQGDTAEQIASLRSTLNQIQQSYQQLILAANQMDLAAAAAQTQVTVVEDALPPSIPYAPRTRTYTLIGLFAGFSLAVGAIALIVYLDNTVKAGLEFIELVGAPLMSVIGTVPKLRAGHDQLYVLERPTSSSAEAIRLLRANIEFSASSREIEAMVVTSAVPGEGKSTVTANLAVAMAQAGYATIVVDADLRRPSQHRIFGVRNERGLTTLLTHPDLPWKAGAVEGLVPNLWVVPSGPLPPNPADLLSLDRFSSIVKEMTRAVDIVLVDTSPILAVSDPLVVASTVHDVLIISRAGRTRIEALRRAIRSLPKDPVRAVGVVVNQQSGRDDGGYYYYYYSGYYGPDEGDPSKRKDPPSGGRLRKNAETAPSA